ACQNVYKFIAGEVGAHDLINSWLAISSGLSREKLESAVEYLEGVQPDNDKWHELFNLQEIFIAFREKAGITENAIEGHSEQGLSKAELVFYNMGMFSQVIEDFEVIHFRDRQQDKLFNFLKFLEYSAKDYYPEG